MSLNVLITAGSRRVPLVRAFQRAVAHHRGGTVVVTDVNPLSPAVHAANRAYRVPLASAPNYIDAILRICLGERIGLVVPTIDDELVLFGEAAARFRAHGIRVAVSPATTSALCEDSSTASRYLSARGVPAAGSWLPGAVPADVAYPLFIKPRRGRGSVGAFAVRSPRDLEFFSEYRARRRRADVPRRPGHDRHAVRLQRPPLSIVPRLRET